MWHGMIHAEGECGVDYCNFTPVVHSDLFPCLNGFLAGHFSLIWVQVWILQGGGEGLTLR